ncbi:hypothetical protein R1W15_004263 [Vibrio fluvialis]|nr:hypothetical protein [Vibrio parahaemolyticus]ELP3316059.1 hypothetical protein [Vibrio fluvialis]
MSYEKHTKFKINKLVAEYLGMETDKELLSDFVLSNDYNERYPDTVWARPEGQPWEQFCFTNEPEGWGKLVQDYSIELSFDTCQVHAKSYFSDTKPFSASRNDIGLAVCIAFLRMKDWQAENK